MGEKRMIAGGSQVDRVSSQYWPVRVDRQPRNKRTMDYLEITRPTTVENLALDEALLLSANQDAAQRETLRLWEEPLPVVIVGRGSRVEAEVDLEACRQRKIAVLRRCSGGCAVVAGPGCLMYSVVLDLRSRAELRVIDRAHAFVLKRMRSAITSCIEPESKWVVTQAGLSDLAIEWPNHVAEKASRSKFSGNSLRITRHALLYHGTILYNFPLEIVSELLRFPPRQPDYRGHRTHEKFLTNLPLAVASIRQAIQQTWSAGSHTTRWPRTLMQRLAEEKYSRAEWNRRH